MHIAKSILQYFKRTISFGLIYKKKDIANFIELYNYHNNVKYVNNNYKKNLKDWKSIINYYVLMNKVFTI